MLSLAAVQNYRRMCLACSLALVAFSVAQVAQADTKLRWKFTKGEKTSYEIGMDVTQDMKLGDMPLSVKMSQVMNMTWEVKDVADDGTATMNQTIDRVRMEMTLPQAKQEPVKYDSDSKEKPAGTEMLSQHLRRHDRQALRDQNDAAGQGRRFQGPRGGPRRIQEFAHAGGRQHVFRGGA